MPARYLETRSIPLDELTPFPGNARRGDVPAIAESLAVNGQYRSIVVRDTGGALIILAGNHTTQGVKFLAGMTPAELAERYGTRIRLAIERAETEVREGLDVQAAHADPDMTDADYEYAITQAAERAEAARHAFATLSEWSGRDVIRGEIIQCDDGEARRINLADNRTAELGGYDDPALAELLASLDGDYEGTGWSDEDITALLGDDPDGTGGAGEGAGTPSLADRFLVPPFDVLDARQGWWRERKHAWIGLGIRSELGRSSRVYQGQESLDRITGMAYDGPEGLGAKTGKYYRRDDEKAGLLFKSASGRDPSYYQQKRAVEARLGHDLTTADFEANHYQPSTDGTGLSSSGTSVFDPVLCELAYRWFCPPGGAVLDPFAGGSVRGLLAAMLGRTYTGNDLSADQVAANGEAADGFAARDLITRDAITWSAGDSVPWVTTLDPGTADMIFTCPPYYNLEVYGDDPADLSAMSFDGFDEAYARIIAGAAAALRADRFAVIVTGDVRDKKGRLRDLRGTTIRVAETAGLTFVNGAVLVTPAGSLPVRAGRSFEGTRTLGRCHQDVLVFCKGGRGAAAKACGHVDVEFPSGDNPWDGEEDAGAG